MEISRDVAAQALEPKQGKKRPRGLDKVHRMKGRGDEEPENGTAQSLDREESVRDCNLDIHGRVGQSAFLAWSRDIATMTPSFLGTRHE